MATRAFVEVIGRHGDVRSRHAIDHWPCRIGRGYDMDVILDDPHVAPSHAEVTQTADGALQIRDLGSRNGIFHGLPGKQMRRTEHTVLGAEDALRLGQTLLRVRPAGHAVAAEAPLTGTPWHRRAISAWILVIVLILLSAAQAYATHGDDETDKLLGDVMGKLVLLVVWVGLWTASGRMITGSALASAHAVIGAVMWMAFLLGEMFINTATFAFGFGREWPIAYAAGAILVAGTALYRHLRLVSRAARPLLLLVAFAVAASVIGAFSFNEALQQDKPEAMQYQRLIFSPRLLLVKGMSRKAFIEEARAIVTPPP